MKIVLALSRVTLGADVAITSVVLSRMKTLFPEARIALVGSAKAGSLFATDSRLELVEVAYPRGGTLRERLDAWVAASQAVSGQVDGLMPEEYLVVDPDSRLTQLGLLPLSNDDSHYYFFDSRSSGSAAAQPLGALTAAWLDQTFGPGEGETGAHEECLASPYVALPSEDMARGRALRATQGRLAAVNLGVGGNPEKRVDDLFELELLKSLLEAGYKLVLDRGAGEEELERTQRLTAALESQGKTVAGVPADGAADAIADVYVWEGSLTGFGGLIAASDLYCGYDSAGGHLAAALGTPVIGIFTDAAQQRMRERWTPSGRAAVRVITARRSAPREALRQFRLALQGRLP